MVAPGVLIPLVKDGRGALGVAPKEGRGAPTFSLDVVSCFAVIPTYFEARDPGDGIGGAGAVGLEMDLRAVGVTGITLCGRVVDGVIRPDAEGVMRPPVGPPREEATDTGRFGGDSVETESLGGVTKTPPAGGASKYRVLSHG